MTHSLKLGQRLRQIRKERDLTQRELATKAGISVNAVSLIERNEISPSVATLQNLATALNIRISYFFDDSVQNKVVHLKAVNRPSITNEGVTIQGVGKHLPQQQLEPFVLTLNPDSGSGKQPVVHAGHEFVYCLEGTITYEIEEIEYQLEPGDVLLFQASLPHRWWNATDKQVQALLVLQNCDETTLPTHHHFPKHSSLSYME